MSPCDVSPGPCGATSPQHPAWRGWLRLALALAILAALMILLIRAPIPPGPAGRVIANNLRHDIQATALFYAELEAMGDIERRLDPEE